MLACYLSFSLCTYIQSEIWFQLSKDFIFISKLGVYVWVSAYVNTGAQGGVQSLEPPDVGARNLALVLCMTNMPLGTSLTVFTVNFHCHIDAPFMK